MIEGLKGVAALKELAAIAQNLEKKLGLPVSVEALQKMMETKDGYKYLANIDGKLTEILSKKELETGVKYWADGVKNQMSNTLTLENLVQKPHILQSEVFKSDTLSKALGFEKLVEVVKAEMAKIVSTPQKTADVATTQPEANKNAASAIRLAAAEAELSRPIAQTIQTTQTITKPKRSSDQKETPKSEPQKVQAQEAATVKSEVAATKETVLKELKAAISASLPTIATQSAKDEPKATKSAPQESTQKSEAPKETQKEVAPQRASEKLSGETLRDKLREFKNIMASLPTVPSKAEMEKAKTESPLYQREAKSASQESVLEAAKTENIEKLLAVLAKNFEGATKNLLEESAKKIADLIFGKLPESEADEAVLKALEHLKKQLNEKAVKSAEKKASPVAAEVGEEVSAKAQDAEQNESAASKTDNPASKLKTQLLEEMAKVVTKNDFQILSQVAMALNKEVFTFVLKDKGVLQFKKKRQKELNAKTVEFYSAFETLGPVSGEISHVDGETTLSLNVEFESTYNFLKENLKDLSFFDHKNVSIMHGIKEIVEIRSSFLDTTG
ncbi:MAG: hypothetical protein JHC37_01015 [Campylobacteraceae bacterium]|jgi:nicotinamidase-related amidase|nr:hypothetical protein [Campylobacteraceae bacterium]